ncbi:MAG TPA: hypothetical protein VMU66_07750 [Gaiellales bacterium]|nr:hypothetical protein [Gaiellales bacterium]
MRLDGFFLCEYARPDPSGGFTAVNAGWSTWNVTEPVPPPPDAGAAPAAVISATVVARLLLTPDESDGSHELTLRLLDADGGELFRGDVQLIGQRDPELPRSWDQQMLLVLPLVGFPLPSFGLYRVELEQQGADVPLGACPFQVIKRYA